MATVNPNQSFSINYGDTFSATPLFTNTPGPWRVVSGTLPDGLSINSTSGAITGTPTKRGSFSPKIDCSRITAFAGGDFLNYLEQREDVMIGLTSTGIAYAWGGYTAGSPVFDLKKTLSSVSKIAAGSKHAIALTTAGKVNVMFDYDTEQTAPAMSGIVDIAAGYDRSYAITSAGQVVPWGNQADGDRYVYNVYGETVFVEGEYLYYYGGATLEGASISRPPQHTTRNIKKIAVGEKGTIGLLSNGAVIDFSWSGEWQMNQVPWNGVPESIAGGAVYTGATFIEEVTPPVPVVEIVASDRDYAARLQDGTVVSWSRLEPRHNPGIVDRESNLISWNPTGVFTKITATRSGFLGLKSNGSLIYWNRNEQIAVPAISNISTISSSQRFFFVHRTNGSVVFPSLTNHDYSDFIPDAKPPGTTVSFSIATGTPILTDGQSFTAKVGVSFSGKLNLTDAADRPATAFSGSVPPGLVLNTSTGAITGTPLDSGPFSSSITASSSKGSSTAVVSFSVEKGAPLFAPNQSLTGKVGVAFSKTPAMQDLADRPVTSWESITLPAGFSINNATGAITATPTKITNFSATIGAGGPGGDSSAVISFSISAGAPIIVPGQSIESPYGSPFNWTFSVDDSGNRPVTSWSATGLPAGLSINSSTGAITGTPTNVGEFNPTITATGPGGADSEQVEILIIAGAPIITSGQSFSGKVGVAFSRTPELTDSENRPVSSWSASGLPAGLSINSTTGEITGSPSKKGAFTSTVVASGSVFSNSKSIAFTISEGAPIITAGQTASGKVGTAFSKTFSLTDSTNRPVTSWSATGLPSWATLNATTGVITGTPQDSGSTTLTLTATGPGGSDTETAVISITVGAPIITSGQSFSGKVGEEFSKTLALDDAADRPASSFTATGLPAGVSISASGQVSGTPTTRGSFNASITPSGSGGTGASTSVSFTIGAGTPIITANQFFTGRVGTAFSAIPALTDAANRQASSWSATGLPSWATLNAPTGAITGTPQDSGTSTITLTATGSGGANTETITIDILVGPPIIVSGQSFTGKVGVAFRETPALDDALDRPATSWSAKGLPAGLSINTTTGEITGTPTAKGSFTASFTATGGGGTSSATSVSFTIAEGAPIITPGQTASGKVGSAFSKTFSLTDSTNRSVTSWSATELPAGIAINTSTGTITGTPQDSGSATITLTATGPGGSDTETATISIAIGSPIIVAGQSFNGKVGNAFSGTISLTDAVDRPATSWSAIGIPTGLSLNTSTGEITGTPTTKGSFTASFTATGNGGTSPATSVSFSISEGAPIIPPNQTGAGKVGEAFSKTFSLTDSTSRPVTSWSATGLPSWATLNTATGAITGTPQDSGSATISLTATGPGGSSSETATISIAIGAPLITSGQTFTGKVGDMFSQALSLHDASDRPATSWSATNLPAGLSINNSGEILGTPSVAGLFSASVTATGSGGTSVTSVGFTIAEGAPIIISGQTGSGEFGTAFSKTFSLIDSANRPVTSWSATGLPAGLAINTTTGAITGTPQDSGSTTISLTATGPGGTDTETAVISIAAGAPIITAGQSFSGKVGDEFSATIGLDDALDRPATSWARTSGTLPAGLTLNTSTGAITGTPTAKGSFTATFTATGIGGASSATSVSFTIAEGVPIITSGQSVTGKVGTAISKTFSLTDSANRPVTSWAVTGLPSWASINPTTGQITGTPQDRGTSIIHLTATGPGGSNTETATISIAVGVPIISAGQTFTGKVGEVFTQTPELDDALDRPATSWSATGLPDGLSLNTSTGAITGTPAGQGSFTSRLTATGIGGTSSATSVSFTIAEGVPIIAAGQTASGKVGSAFSKTFSLTDSANRPVTNWSATGLPEGLSLNPATGAITGTPQDVGSATVTLTATGPGGTATKSATISITVGSPIIVAGQSFTAKVGVAFSGTPALEDALDRPATSWGATGLPDGLSLDVNTGNITGTPTAKGSFSATFTAAGEGGDGSSRIIVFTIAEGAPAIPPNQAKNGKVGFPFLETFEIPKSSDRPVSSVSATGLPSWASLEESAVGLVVSGIPDSAGASTITLRAEGSGGITTEPATISIVDLTPQIEPDQSFSAKVGEPFNNTPSLTSSFAESWEATGLPAGLAIDATTGAIAGTPTTLGSFAVTVAAKNGGTDTDSVTINVAPGAVVIPPGQQFFGQFEVAFSASPALTDPENRPATSWSAIGLPSWASIDSATGEITGTPDSSGRATITITAAGDGGSSTQSVVLAIAAGAPLLEQNQTFTGKVGEIFLKTPALVDAEDRPAALWSATDLPQGLSINSSTGAITGTPATYATATASITVSNDYGSDSADIIFTIAAGQPILVDGQKFQGKTQTALNFTIAQTDSANRPATTWAATGLPSGLVISAATGVISGTVPGALQKTATVTASGPGGSDSTTITFAFISGPPILQDLSFEGFLSVGFRQIVASGAPIANPITTCTAKGLPEGLTISGTGFISGIPRKMGKFKATVTAGNFAGTTSAQVSITITARSAYKILAANNAFPVAVEGTKRIQAFPSGIVLVVQDYAVPTGQEALYEENFAIGQKLLTYAPVSDEELEFGLRVAKAPEISTRGDGFTTYTVTSYGITNDPRKRVETTRRNFVNITFTAKQITTQGESQTEKNYAATISLLARETVVTAAATSLNEVPAPSDNAMSYILPSGASVSSFEKATFFPGLLGSGGQNTITLPPTVSLTAIDQIQFGPYYETTATWGLGTTEFNFGTFYHTIL